MADSYITKKALAAALRELLEETSFEKINVAAICEKCGMNRKSFYYHFRDKYDLVNWIFDTDFIDLAREHYGSTDDLPTLSEQRNPGSGRSRDELLDSNMNAITQTIETRAASAPSGDVWEFFESLCVYFYENQSFYRKVLKVTGQNSFSEHFREFIYPLLRERLRPVFGTQDIPPLSIDFVTDGVVCALERWLAGRHCLPPQEFVSSIRSLVEGLSRSVCRDMDSSGTSLKN